MAKPYFSLIIPCYMEGPTLTASVNKIIKELNKLKKTWEIIFVEDASSDATKENLQKIIGEIKNARIIYHKKNQGRGKSVKEGLIKARGEICGFLDVDLEVSEKYIPIFIAEIENGADMVVGRRYYEGSYKSLGRYLGSKVYSYFVRFILGLKISDTEAGYKFFRRSKIMSVLLATRDNHWFWDTEICARAEKAGLTVAQIPVLFIRRAEKKSTVRLIPDTIDYIKKLIKFKLEVSK